MACIPKVNTRIREIISSAEQLTLTFRHFAAGNFLLYNLILYKKIIIKLRTIVYNYTKIFIFLITYYNIKYSRVPKIRTAWD